MGLSLRDLERNQGRHRIITYAIVGFLTILTLVIILVLSVKTQQEQTYNLTFHAQESFLNSIPANNRALGLVYDGLELSSECPNGFKLHASSQTSGRALCSHGPDPAPTGFDISQSVSPINVKGAQTNVLGTTVTCDGDGQSGNRVQVLYVHASDVIDRYSTYLSSFQQWTANNDAIYSNSALETGGSRHVRFVHDANCLPVIPDVALSATGDDSFSNTVSELSAQGYNRSDRDYMIFEDASVYCGIGNIRSNDSAAATNSNNSGREYGRTDNGCWGGNVTAHELMHNLGAVQLSAPHTSGYWHCVDEYDRMCYSDAAGVTMQYICTNSSHDSLFDCNHDDYYSTNPVIGSYLATHWNTANSSFLVGGFITIPTLTPLPTLTPFPDTVAPTITSYSPQNGTLVQGLVKVKMTATDPSGIGQLKISIDGAIVKTCNAVTNCSFNWQTRTFLSGQHSIRYQASDTRGNSTNIDITVTK